MPRVSFGKTNYATVGARGSSGGAIAATVASDRSVFVGGFTSHDAGEHRFEQDIAIVKFKKSGKVDRRFGRGGLVVSSFAKRHDETVVALAVDPQGRLIVASFFNLTPINSGSDARQALQIVRYTAHGSVDRSFGQNGVSRIETPGGFGAGQTAGVVVAPSGSIEIAGNDGFGFYLLDLTADGILNKAFGNNGFARGPKQFTLQMYAYGIVLDADARPVVLGYWSPVHANRSCAVARFDDAGNLDNAFADHGVRVFPASGSPRFSNCKNGVLAGSSLRVFGAGTGAADTNGKAIRARNPLQAELDLSGELTSTFGSNGVSVAPAPSAQALLPLGLASNAAGQSIGISETPHGNGFFLMSFGASGVPARATSSVQLGAGVGTTCAATNTLGVLAVCGSRASSRGGVDFAMRLGHFQ